MPRSVGRVVPAPVKSVWLYLNLVPALLFAPAALTTERVVTALVVAFVTVCVGHSVGLHRGVIHGAYRCHAVVRAAFCFCFVFTGLGGPLSWVRLHEARDHWQSELDCPGYFQYRHNILQDYLWNLHTTFVPRIHDAPGGRTADDGDRWLSFLEKTWWLWNLALFFFVCFACSFDAAVVVCCARVAVTIIMHWYVGFMAHKHGQRRYAIEGASEEGRNVLLLGWLSFGEGFHNNHHACPRSARMGQRWCEFDVGYGVVRACEFVGLVDDVIDERDPRALREGASLLRDHTARGRLEPRHEGGV